VLDTLLLVLPTKSVYKVYFSAETDESNERLQQNKVAVEKNIFSNVQLHKLAPVPTTENSHHYGFKRLV
jgi:hypothetical protein